jgi:hypothetical protein
MTRGREGSAFGLLQVSNHLVRSPSSSPCQKRSYQKLNRQASIIFSAGYTAQYFANRFVNAVPLSLRVFFQPLPQAINRKQNCGSNANVRKFGKNLAKRPFAGT